MWVYVCVFWECVFYLLAFIASYQFDILCECICNEYFSRYIRIYLEKQSVVKIYNKLNQNRYAVYGLFALYFIHYLELS